MFCIYMPADSDIENYTATLYHVQALLSFYTLKGTVILGGDFNGQLVYGNEKPSNQKSKLLSKFDNSLHSLHHVFRSKAFTFTPTQTTVDHILVERSAIPTFKSYCVIPSNDIVTSDHLPLVFQMNMASSNEPITSPTANKNINWKKCSALHLHNFQQKVNTFVTSLCHKHSLDDLDPEILNSAIINCFREAEKHLPSC